MQDYQALQQQLEEAQAQHQEAVAQIASLKEEQAKQLRDLEETSSLELKLRGVEQVLSQRDAQVVALEGELAASRAARTGEADAEARLRNQLAESERKRAAAESECTGAVTKSKALEKAHADAVAASKVEVEGLVRELERQKEQLREAMKLDASKQDQAQLDRVEHEKRGLEKQLEESHREVKRLQAEKKEQEGMVEQRLRQLDASAHELNEIRQEIGLLKQLQQATARAPESPQPVQPFEEQQQQILYTHQELENQLIETLKIKEQQEELLINQRLLESRLAEKHQTEKRLENAFEKQQMKQSMLEQQQRLLEGQMVERRTLEESLEYEQRRNKQLLESQGHRALADAEAVARQQIEAEMLRTSRLYRQHWRLDQQVRLLMEHALRRIAGGSNTCTCGQEPGKSCRTRESSGGVKMGFTSLSKRGMKLLLGRVDLLLTAGRCCQDTERYAEILIHEGWDSHNNILILNTYLIPIRVRTRALHRI